MLGSLGFTLCVRKPRCDFNRGTGSVTSVSSWRKCLAQHFRGSSAGPQLLPKRLRMSPVFTLNSTSPVNVFPQRQQVLVQMVGFLHPHGKTRLRSQLLSVLEFRKSTDGWEMYLLFPSASQMK